MSVSLLVHFDESNFFDENFRNSRLAEHRNIMQWYKEIACKASKWLRWYPFTSLGSTILWPPYRTILLDSDRIAFSCRSELKASKTPESTALTPINITIELDWIIEVDTALGSWIGIIWFGLSWYDHRLSWNKTDYNVSKITVPGSQIWIPDFRDVELAGDGDAKSDIRKEMFVVHNDGLVIGQVRRKHTNNCIIMPKYYPYETGYSTFFLTFLS